MPTTKPRILLWDIETSFMQVATFSLYPKFISHKNIIKDWYIIGGAWKWLGEDKIHSAYNSHRNHDNDKKVVQELAKAVEKSDIIIGHNGDKFDLPKLNARIAYHGLDPLPYIPSVDTLRVARRHFRFTCNRLDYLATHLCGHGKMDTPDDLWMDAMAGKKEALQIMEEYNKVDVSILEDVYLRLRPFMDRHPNLNLLGETTHSCPNCGSVHVQKRGFYRTRVSTFQRYQCKDCGAWSRGKSAEFRSDIR